MDKVREDIPLQMNNGSNVIAECTCNIFKSTIINYLELFASECGNQGKTTIVPEISLTYFGFMDNGMHNSSFIIHATQDSIHGQSIKISFPKKHSDCAEFEVKGTSRDIINNLDVMMTILRLYTKTVLCESENICVTLSCPHAEHTYSTDAFKRLQESFMSSCKNHLKDVIKMKKPTVRLDQCDARYTNELNKDQTVSFICHPPLVQRYYQIIGDMTLIPKGETEGSCAQYGDAM